MDGKSKRFYPLLNKVNKIIDKLIAGKLLSPRLSGSEFKVLG